MPSEQSKHPCKSTRHDMTKALLNRSLFSAVDATRLAILSVCCTVISTPKVGVQWREQLIKWTRLAAHDTALPCWLLLLLVSSKGPVTAVTGSRVWLLLVSEPK
jgi:hypothetical protein